MKFKTSISEGLLSLICVYIFLFSACSMISDVYQWGNIGFGGTLPIMIILFLINLIFVFSDETFRFVKWLIPVIIMAGIAIYLFVMNNDVEIYEQIKQMASYYMREWDAYYGNIMILIKDESEYVAKGLQFVLAICFMLVFWLAKITGKNILMSVIPFAVLILEHLAGSSPDSIGIILLFIGILLNNSAGWKKTDFEAVSRKNLALKKTFIWIVTGCFITLLCVTIKITGTDSANNMLKHTETMKKIRNELFEKLLGIDYEGALFGVDGEGDSDSLDVNEGEITNDKPDNKHEPVMEITLKDMPLSNIYLKGFHANTYLYGNWLDGARESFKKNALSDGLNADKLVNDIASVGIQTFENNYEDEELAQYIKPTEGSIKYIRPATDKVYMPYFAQTENESVEMVYDTLYKKTEEAEPVSDLSFNMWSCNNDIESWYKKIKNIKVKSWEEWYWSYQSISSEITGNLDTVYQVMEKFLDEIFEDDKFHEMFYDEEKEDYDYNAYLLYMTEQVKEWLRENTSYSTELDELPEDVEAIEYFVKTGKKGYCVHYASTAAVILGSMGHNVRYATGYVATADTFKKSGDEYKATVYEDNAHAWIEIYIDGIGWFPIEVTEGYSFEERMENVEENEATPTPAATTKPQNKEDKKDDKNDNGKGKGTQKTFTIVLVIIISVLIITLISFVVRRKMNSRKRLLRAIEKKQTLRAVKLINRLLYKKLRNSGKFFNSNLNDDAYKEILKKTYEDVSDNEWEEYMVIVKAAAFSQRFITEEEMGICYEIYKKCC